MAIPPTVPSTEALSSPWDGLPLCLLVQGPLVLMLLELAGPDPGVPVLPQPVGVLDRVLASV